MQYCKITISKTRTDSQTDFIYPDGYDPKAYNIVCYENRGKNKEYAIATTPDSTVPVEGIAVITKSDAEGLIDQFVISDKDIDNTKRKKAGKTRDLVKLNKKNALV